MIDPGPRTIQGAGINQAGGDSSFAFDTGTFFGKPVYLGELRTDHEGRLVFLGGRGLSQPSDDKHPLKPGEFANNDDWHDDVSDGPVDATVRIGDRVLEATGAWVIVAPPDYAPGISAIVTGYDLVSQAATELDASYTAGRPSFSREILPLLVRLVNYQWVNAGFFEEFGWGSPIDFSQPDLARRLGDPSDASLPLRLSVFRRFRDPNAIELQANAWPSIYGDAVEFSVTAIDPLGWMPILKSQYESLRRWAEGDFDVDRPKGWVRDDGGGACRGLDRAALENTIGGPFHPGAEFTWPLRQTILYDAPFRIKRRQGPPPDLGLQLTSALALMTGGPLDGSGPGDLTPLDGRPLADRHGELPVGLSALRGRIPPHVLARAGAERRADRPAVRQDHGRGLLSLGAGRRVRSLPSREVAARHRLSLSESLPARDHP